jgi:ATP-dependent DNA ligase
VRLFTRNGHDWSDRYPWIVETARKNRHNHFVIDGEAVLLGVDGISDFNALQSRQREGEVQLYAFDILALDGEDLRGLPLSLRKTNLARLLARRPRRHLRGAVRAGRNRSRPVQGRVQHGA